jgi:endoglucanase
MPVPPMNKTFIVRDHSGFRGFPPGARWGRLDPRVSHLRSLIAFSAGSLLLACQPKNGAPASAPAAAPAADPAPTVSSYPPVAPIPGLKRCVNLGNGLDAPKEGEWGVTLEKAHFELAKAGGFDHVRLPVRFSAHAAATAPFTIEEAFFQRVDWAVGEALAAGLAIIVDVHHYNELMDDPDAHVDRLLGLWKQIAERYASRPESVIFEIINEPSKKLTPDKLNALYEKAIPLVRASNPKRLIMVDSFFWASTEHLTALKLPDDPNIIAHFHMYQPILFTHQGAPWMDPEFRTMGVVFPGPPAKPLEPSPDATKVDWVRGWFAGYNTVRADQNPSGPNTIRIEFDRASSYAQSTGRRVYLGEFGAIDKADMDSRVRFLTNVREEAEKRGIAWCYWDDGGAFKLMNVKDKTFVEPLRKALLP